MLHSLSAARWKARDALSDAPFFTAGGWPSLNCRYDSQSFSAPRGPLGFDLDSIRNCAVTKEAALQLCVVKTRASPGSRAVELLRH